MSEPRYVQSGPLPALASDYATATHAAAAISYLAGGANMAHVIAGAAWSYAGGTLAGGNLQIADGSAVVFNLDITAAGPGIVYFDPPKVGSPNTAMTITLADGSASVVGKVNALGHKLDPLKAGSWWPLSGSVAGGYNLQDPAQSAYA